VLTAGDDQEETGWKYIHGDVFRFPPYRNVFCAFVGTGSQLLTLSVCIFALVRRNLRDASAAAEWLIPHLSLRTFLLDCHDCVSSALPRFLRGGSYLLARPHTLMRQRTASPGEVNS